MANRHATQDELDRFIKGELAPDELAQLDRHLDACDECRGALSESSPVASAEAFLARISMGEQHLNFAALESVMERRIVSPQIQAHLDSCESCALDLADLRAFENTRAATRVARTPPPVSLWSRLTGWLSLSNLAGPGDDMVPAGSRRLAGSRLAWVAACAVAALAIVVLLPRTFGPGTDPDPSASSTWAAAAFDPLTPEQRQRLPLILRGVIPPPTTTRTVAELWDHEQALWEWAQGALADEPLLQGAIAEDLGLTAEAAAAYGRALARPADAEVARNLIDRLPQAP